MFEIELFCRCSIIIFVWNLLRRFYPLFLLLFRIQILELVYCKMGRKTGFLLLACFLVREIFFSWKKTLLIFFSREQTLQYFSDSPCCAFLNFFYDGMKRDPLIGTTHVSILQWFEIWIIVFFSSARQAFWQRALLAENFLRRT